MKSKYLPPNNLGNQSLFNGLLYRALLVACLAIGLIACDRSSQSNTAGLNGPGKKSNSRRMQNPVESKDGMAYIPIDDTAFLIPEKTWLKSYGRKATDGSVSTIILHATVPDVQPWSQERHEEMYWPAGPGKKLLIYIEGARDSAVKVFSNVPQSLNQSFEFIEESSDQASQGLRQFRALHPIYSEKILKESRKYGDDFVSEMKRDSGGPMKGSVYYEYIKEDRVIYYIRCDDERSPRQIWMDCNLYLPMDRSLLVRVNFLRDHLDQIVPMAEKLRIHLDGFNAAGLEYRAGKVRSQSTIVR